MINHRTDDDCVKEIAIITIYKTTQPVEKYHKAVEEDRRIFIDRRSEITSLLVTPMTSPVSTKLFYELSQIIDLKT